MLKKIPFNKHTELQLRDALLAFYEGVPSAYPINDFTIESPNRPNFRYQYERQKWDRECHRKLRARGYGVIAKMQASPHKSMVILAQYEKPKGKYIQGILERVMYDYLPQVKTEVQYGVTY